MNTEPKKIYLKTITCPVCNTKGMVRKDFDCPKTMRCCEKCGADFNTAGDITGDPRTL